MKRIIISLLGVVMLVMMMLPAISPPPVSAAAPSVLSVTETAFGTSSQTHNVQMPATVAPDDLLIVLFVNTGTATVTTPSGWNFMSSAYRDSGSANGNSVRFSVYYKKAVGTEDGTQVDFSTSPTSTRAAAQVYRISATSWHTTTPPEISTAATGTSNSPDPGSLDPTGWGTEETLWIAACGFGDDDGMGGYPSNYTNGEETIGSGSGDDCELNSARRENNTASEDPGSFNIDGSDSERWVAFTIAIRPAVATTGTITIVKNTIPDDPQNFEFTRNFGGNFFLDDDANLTLSNTITFSSLAPGTYTVNEIEPSGWYLAAINCTGDDNIVIGDTGVTIDLDAGEDVTCTFTNCNNPPLEESCGLDVVLVMDESSSIDGGEFAQMQSAFVDFVDALSGTPTQFALVDFGTIAYLRSGFTSDYTAIKALINDTKLTGTQWTNWQDALRVARGLFPNRDNPDLIIFTSDGNPNRIGNSPSVEATEAAAVAAAVVEANAAKSAGIRILTIGIGGGTGQYEGLNPDNLIAISCSNALWMTDFDELADTLAELASVLCGGTITVHKIIDCDGDYNTTNDQSDGGNWTFTANVDSPGSSNPLSGDTDNDGEINFAIGFGGECDATVSIVETLEPGFTLLYAVCTGATDNGLFDNTDSIDRIILDSDDIVTCTFYNQPPPITCTIRAPDSVCANSTGHSASTVSGYASYSWTVKSGNGTITGGADTDTITWDAGAAGTVTLQVTVTDAYGCQSTCEKTVTVYEKPTCNITARPDSKVCVGNNITLTEDGGHAVAWLWSTAETTQSIVVSANGTYSVTITDANGCTSTCEKEVTVYEKPTCHITASPGTEVCAGNNITLTEDGGHAVEWLWSTAETTQSIVVSANGTYSVTITDANDCQSTCEKEVTVYEKPTCHISASPGTEVCAGNNITLTEDGGHAVEWLWSTAETTQSIVVSANGTYSVTITDANDCQSTCEKEVTVYEKPTCHISASPGTEVCAGNNITLTEDGGHAVEWLWSTAETTSSIVVSANGTYSVTITDANDCQSTCEKEVTVYEKPTCHVTASPGTEVCAGNNITLTEDGGHAVEWLWSTAETTQSIVVSANGTYGVTITDANDCQSTCEKEVTVYEKPTCHISASPGSEVCAGNNITLTEDGGHAVSWNWTTGETTQFIVVSANGTYGVTITDRNGCKSYCDIEVTVYEKPTCHISASPGTEVCAGNNITLIEDGGHAVEWLWSTAETTQSIVVSSSGTYSVTITDANCCQSTCEIEVTVYSCEECGAIAPPFSICINTPLNDALFISHGASCLPIAGCEMVDLDYSGVDNSQAGIYSYNVTCVLCSEEVSPPEYRATGSHTATGTVTVLPKPNASFSALPRLGCAPLTVKFINQSTGNPTSWSWDFGDGGTSSLPNPFHTYTTPGTYYVSLTVANACGSDTDRDTCVIVVFGVPTAAFNALPTNGCAPLTVNFTDLSTGDPWSWSWDVDGDGNEDYNTPNPSHTYTSAGNYTVSLTVSNDCGSDTETGYITAEPCGAPVPTTLVLLPEEGSNPVDTTHNLTATVYDQFKNVMEGVAVTWNITGVGSFSGSPEGVTDGDGEADAVITSSESGISTVTCEVTGNPSVSDTATKEWTYEPVATTLELLPEEGSNPVDTTHNLTATVYDQFGYEMEGVAVTWSISGVGTFSGTPESVTNYAGKASAVITSSVPGISTVTCEVTGNPSVSDTATKEWTYIPEATTLELWPETGENPVGTTHNLTATVRDQFNNVMEGVVVTWSISGVGTFAGTSEGVTDADGEADAVITSSEPGISTVTCEVTGNPSVSDTATKEWTYIPEATTLELWPETGENPVGTTHDLTATVYDQFGYVMEGVAVTWNITGVGTFSGSPEGVTDGNGEADAVITSSEPGTSTVTCEVTGNPSVSDTATKEWEVPVATTLELWPETGENPVGTLHQITATVYDQFDYEMAGVPLTWNISGVGSFSGSPEGVTDVDGEADAVITSSDPGTSTVTCEVTGNPSVSDTATKTWMLPVPTTLELWPETGENPVGTTHDLTATVRDQFNNVMEDVAVTWNISGVGSFSGSPEGVTDVDGEADAVITSSEPGTSTVTCEVTGTPSVSDTATKTWMLPVPTTLELWPETGENPVGTTHDLTATVRDQFNNVMEDVAVTWNISGVGSFSGSPEGVTDGNGEADAVITSSDPGTSTVTCEVTGNPSVSGTATKTWMLPVATILELAPPSATNILPDDTTEEFTVTVKDQYENGMSGQVVSLTTTFGTLSVDQVTTGVDGTATFTISSTTEGTATITATLGDLTDTATKTWTLEIPVPTTLELLPEEDSNAVNTTHALTATVYDQFGYEMAGVPVTWNITGVGIFAGTPESVTNSAGEASAVITSNVTGISTVRCEVTGNTSVFAIATKTWTTEGPSPTPGGGGVGAAAPLRYLTVDWDGIITRKPLYSNDRLTQDLLGPSPDGKHSLLLERKTLAPTVNGKRHYLIVIRELELEEIPTLPENTVASVVFNVTPAGAVFDKDIFLALGLNQSQLPENAQNVTMAYYDDINGVWVPLEYEAGGPNGVAELILSAPINHFSIFGVLVELAAPTPPPPPAHFVPSGLSIAISVEKIWEPVTFVTKTGESVTITANVANDGGQEGTYTVELKLNGETVETKTVTLGAGESQPVRFTVSGLDYGQHEVDVAGLSGEFTTSRTITWWLIIVIIVAIGLISWGVVWGRRRGRAAQEG